MSTFEEVWNDMAYVQHENREKKTAFDMAFRISDCIKRNTKKASTEDEDWRTVTKDRRLCRKVIQKATKSYGHSHL